MRRIVLAILGFLGSCGLACCLWMHIELLQQGKQTVETAFVEFPYAIPGTPLVVEGLVSYEGAFLENIAREEVSEVAALMVRNTGEYGVGESKVIVKQDSRILRFFLTELPPKSSMLVLEEAAQRYSREPVQACEGTATCEKDGWYPEQYLEIREIEPGGLEIINCWTASLQGLRFCYKPAYPEGNFYLGGITWDFFVGELEPGETVQVYPEHYCCGVSKILRCVWEEQTQ